MLSPRFLLPRVLAALCASVFVMCGPGSESGNNPTDTQSYTIYVPDEDDNGNSDSLRALDHDGGASDLSLTWTEDTRNVQLCPGTTSMNFSVVNNSGHSPGRNLWFTILYYQGYEYVTGHSISPQGIDVPVGATQGVEFDIALRDEFASADREIVIALIVQTDNPNFGDPDAFFQRLWLRITPQADCGLEAMEQPPRENLNIQSVACENHLVRFQVGERLYDVANHGDPTVSAYDSNYLQLVRDGYLEAFGGRNHWWADLRVTNQIPNDRQASAVFGTNPADNIIFHLAPRVECGGGGWVDFTGAGEAPPPVNGDPPADPVAPPVDPDDPPTDPVDPPVDPDDPPTDPVAPPVDPDDPPTDPVAPPVDPEDPPTDPVAPPVDPEDPPVDPEDPPTDPDDDFPEFPKGE